MASLPQPPVPPAYLTAPGIGGQMKERYRAAPQGWSTVAELTGQSGGKVSYLWIAVQPLFVDANGNKTPYDGTGIDVLQSRMRISVDGEAVPGIFGLRGGTLGQLWATGMGYRPLYRNNFMSISKNNPDGFSGFLRIDIPYQTGFKIEFYNVFAPDILCQFYINVEWVKSLTAWPYDPAYRLKARVSQGMFAQGEEQVFVNTTVPTMELGRYQKISGGNSGGLVFEGNDKARDSNGGVELDTSGTEDTVGGGFYFADEPFGYANDDEGMLALATSPVEKLIFYRFRRDLMESLASQNGLHLGWLCGDVDFGSFAYKAYSQIISWTYEIGGEPGVGGDDEIMMNNTARGYRVGFSLPVGSTGAGGTGVQITNPPGNFTFTEEDATTRRYSPGWFSVSDTSIFSNQTARAHTDPIFDGSVYFEESFTGPEVWLYFPKSSISCVYTVTVGDRTVVFDAYSYDTTPVEPHVKISGLANDGTIHTVRATKTGSGAASAIYSDRIAYPGGQAVSAAGTGQVDGTGYQSQRFNANSNITRTGNNYSSPIGDWNVYTKNPEAIPFGKDGRYRFRYTGTAGVRAAIALCTNPNFTGKGSTMDFILWIGANADSTGFIVAGIGAADGIVTNTVPAVLGNYYCLHVRSNGQIVIETSPDSVNWTVIQAYPSPLASGSTLTAYITFPDANAVVENPSTLALYQ